MKIIRNRLFLAMALGHTTVDTFNNSGPVLIAFLSIPLGLSNAQIGLAASLYTLGGSVLQPVFGWLADRYGSRWLAGLGVFWLLSFMALATFAAGLEQFIWLLIPYSLASLGSAVYHPVAVATASDAGKENPATATAFFFLFGQMGLAGGPVLAGYLLQHVGLTGIQLMALFFAPVVIFILTAPFPPSRHRQQTESDTTDEPSSTEAVRWGALILLAVLIATRSWAQLGTITFLPKLFQDKGWDPAAYGAITGAMWLGSAIMGVLAGTAADRWGRKRVVFWMLAGAVVPLYFLPVVDGWVAFAMALLAGGMLGAPHSILVVIAQALLPGKKAMASGLTLGYMFAMGAVANYGIGWLADRSTLAGALQLGAGVSLAGALLALALPHTKSSTVLQEQS